MTSKQTKIEMSILQQNCDEKDTRIEALEDSLQQISKEKKNWMETEKELITTKQKISMRNEKV